MHGLKDGEKVLREGRAGYQTNFNRGHLVLTNRRLIWEQSLSIDPFGGREFSVELSDIRHCENQGDAIVFDAGAGEVFLFVDWLPLSLINGNRRAKEWLRAIEDALATVAAAG